MAQDVLADGFVRLCIDTSLNVYGEGCRVLVEGQMDTAVGTATPDTLVRVQTSRDVETQFGPGSVLAETLALMFETGASAIDIYAIPRADPAGATAAVYTTTITGPATSDGRIEVFMLDGRYAIDFRVANGATAINIAASFVAEVPTDFPYAAVDNGDGTITWTAKSGVRGTVGNFMSFRWNWRGLQTYPPTGVTMTHVLTTAGTGDLTGVDYSILGQCCYSCVALLSSSEAAQEALQAYLDGAWSCDSPQCFGHGYTYNDGTLGQILARGTNAATLSRVAVNNKTMSPPWFLVGAYAALSCASTCDAPELSVQGQNYGVLEKLNIPESCVEMWTFDEVTQLKTAGFVVTGPLAGGTGSYTSPYVYNDVTNWLYDEKGRPNATFRDVNSRRLATATAIAIATQAQTYSGLGLFTKNTTIKAGVFGTNPRLMLADIRAWAKDNIGVLFSEFDDINSDITLKTDFDVAAKCQGKPGKLHLNFRYQPPVRVEDMTVNMVPKLLSNCKR